MKQDSSILEIASERCMLAAVKEERVAMSHKWLSAPTTTDKVCPTVCDNSSLSAWELPCHALGVLATCGFCVTLN